MILTHQSSIWRPFSVVFALSLVLFGGVARAGEALLNVSYDATREMYAELNKAFVEGVGGAVRVRQSHGGSGKQARSVLEGLRADVVSLALAYDVNVLARRGKLMSTNWQSALPNNSCPYTSTVVFLVRRGNPKGIKDWPDLVGAGVTVITPNPKTSGGARWNYLAAYGYALRAQAGRDEEARKFVGRLLANVPILDAGARGATMTFVKRGIGDVLLAWESEALLAAKEYGEFEVVYPSVSVLAEPPVALVERNARRRGTTELAQKYLEFLYGGEGQGIMRKHYFRTVQHSGELPQMEMFTVEDVFGGWDAAHEKHFAEGGVFDQMYLERFQ